MYVTLVSVAEFNVCVLYCSYCVFIYCVRCQLHVGWAINRIIQYAACGGKEKIASRRAQGVLPRVLFIFTCTSKYIVYVSEW